MKRIAYSCLALVSASAAPALAATLPSGEVIISQAAVNAGNITPGDTPGFPVTLSVPGSYRLTSSLTVTTPVNGIEVRANEISIDMGGFTLAGSGAGRNGIASFNRSLRVANGNVRGFTNDGIRTIAQYLSVTAMLVTGNGRMGIFTDVQTSSDPDAASFASISDSKVTANGSAGIICVSCRVENSLVALNNGDGIIFYRGGGLALGNTAISNLGSGISFAGSGGAGNNTAVGNSGSSQIGGFFINMQPNACTPACTPP